MSPRVFPRKTKARSCRACPDRGDHFGRNLGYHYIEGWPWIDFFEEAAMLLSGIGSGGPIADRRGAGRDVRGFRGPFGVRRGGTYRESPRLWRLVTWRGLGRGLDQAAMRVVADYRIDLDNFNLGSFRFTTTLNGSDYRVRGAGHFSVLGGILYDLRTTTASSGKLTNGGPQPTMYALSYAGGGDSANSACPSMREPSRHYQLSPRGPVILAKSQLQKNSLWARSILLRRPFFMSFDDPNGDLKVCDRTVPVFDGGWRFDLVLTPKRKVSLRKKATTAYSSHAVVCRVKFKPISGYAPDDPNIRLMSHTDAIEVARFAAWDRYVCALPPSAADGFRLTVSDLNIITS